MREGRKRPTVWDVAKAANVSQMTVSRAFSGKAPVALKTRERILRIADAMGFEPHPLAQGLNGSCTRTIGLLWSLLGPHDRTSVAAEIARKAQALGYCAFTAEHDGDRDSLQEVLRQYYRHQVDAIFIDEVAPLVEDGELAKLLGEFPAVIGISHQPVESDFDIIILDRLAALRDATRYLVRAGRKRFLYISPADVTVPRKLEAIRQELEELGLPEQKNLHLEVRLDHLRDYTPAIYSDALNLRYPDAFPHDAVLCSEDKGAVAVISWLRERGYAVPKDVAVTGLNNEVFTPFLSPPLASVDRCNDEVVSTLVKMMQRRLEDPHMPPQRANLTMRFVPRASAGGPL